MGRDVGGATHERCWTSFASRRQFSAFLSIGVAQELVGDLVAFVGRAPARPANAPADSGYAAVAGSVDGGRVAYEVWIPTPALRAASALLEPLDGLLRGRK